MTMYEIITKKKHNAELSADEINWVVAGYVSGSIPDYQMSALLMAVCFSSMSDRETTELTMAMAHSGDMLELNRSKFGSFCVDKHSTGGVGDKTTLIVAPIVASCGVFVPKMSGRGLGHTGGTIDKLESIPGFCTALDFDRFMSVVKSAGFAVAGQTGKLVPADKKMYALRDATATVDSIPLICSSIMSKKLATGADGIVLDVKTGDGAFMKNESDAEKLAQAMVNAASLAGKRCTAVLTDMDNPLGHAVGNSMEVIEAIEALKGNAPDDLMQICMTLATEMLFLAGKGTPQDCASLAENALTSGKALAALEKMIELQGGNPQVIYDYSLFAQPERQLEIFSKHNGVIKSISCEKTGLIALSLGAGRKTKEADIDPSAGIVLKKSVGDRVCKGEHIATLYTSSDCPLDEIGKEFLCVYNFCNDESSIVKKNIKKIIRGY